MDAISNLAERQLRTDVISRKLSCGNISRKLSCGNKRPNGNNTWAILASLAAACNRTAERRLVL
ncbi:MAG: hypothetical protein AAFZ17_02615 [Cyanobacteria bacterium J06650_10]